MSDGVTPTPNPHPALRANGRTEKQLPFALSVAAAASRSASQDPPTSALPAYAQGAQFEAHRRLRFSPPPIGRVGVRVRVSRDVVPIDACSRVELFPPRGFRDARLKKAGASRLLFV